MYVVGTQGCYDRPIVLGSAKKGNYVRGWETYFRNLWPRDLIILLFRWRELNSLAITGQLFCPGVHKE